MSSSIAGYMKRLAVLERSKSEIDPLELAFDTLTDNELVVLEQYMQLAQAGYAKNEIKRMMGDEIYKQAREIIEKVNAKLARLEDVGGLKNLDY